MFSNAYRMLLICGILACPAARCFADETLPFLTVDTGGFRGASIRDLAISDDERWLAAAGDKQVRIWDLRLNRLHAVLRGFQLDAGLKLGRANSVCFSPGGNPKYLVVGISDNTDLGSTRVYNMDDLSQFTLLEGHTACTDRVAFSRDGRYLASWG